MQNSASSPSSTPIPPDQQQEERLISLILPKVKPWVAYTLLGASILVYVLQLLTESNMGVDIPLVLGAKINDMIREGEYWRLLTPVLLHASIQHIAFNMYALFSFGPGIERFYGHTRFLALYGLSALGGNVLSFLFSPGVSVGASTAIFGLVAAEGVFIYQNRRLLGSGSRSDLINIAFIVLVNLALGFSPGIDNWGHLGGLLTGFAFAWFAGPILKVRASQAGFELVDSRENSYFLLAGTGIFFIWAALAFSALL